MASAPNLAGPACPALSGMGVLEAAGPDAGAFLQAQCMNDVAALSVGQWQWNGWLTPKGRLRALFALLRRGPDVYWLVLPDHPVPALREALQRFVFRSRVRLEASAVPVPAAGPARPGQAPDRPHETGDGAVVLDLPGDGVHRGWWLLAADDPRLAPPDPAVDAAWLGDDLRHGLPRLPESQQEAWTPQMLSLERLSAYSLAKGCYPGQEVVSRTHYLGQAKRSLACLEGEGLQPGAEVRGPGGVLGPVVSATPDGRLGLAVLPRDAATDALSGPAGALRHRPLLPGLARPARAADGAAAPIG